MEIVSYERNQEMDKDIKLIDGKLDEIYVNVYNQLSLKMDFCDGTKRKKVCVFFDEEAENKLVKFILRNLSGFLHKDITI